MNRITDYKKLAENITSWLRDYATTNNIKSLVVGVSGGIDSAVVSALCEMTGLPVYVCVIDIHSDFYSGLERAYNHVFWLHKRSREGTGNGKSLVTAVDRNLNRVLMEYRESAKLEDPHIIANAKSRMRMMVLYETASLHQGIVVGTGNKVEDFGVGFYTKYGDGGVDISPIADLYKTEVRELGRYLGVSEEIINAHPCDGLWADCRTDEQVLGATYEELEAVMNYYDTGEGQDLLNLGDTRIEIVTGIYDKLHQQNLHKMLPIPIYKLPL